VGLKGGTAAAGVTPEGFGPRRDCVSGQSSKCDLLNSRFLLLLFFLLIVATSFFGWASTVRRILLVVEPGAGDGRGGSGGGGKGLSKGTALVDVDTTAVLVLTTVGKTGEKNASESNVVRIVAMCALSFDGGVSALGCEDGINREGNAPAW